MFPIQSQKPEVAVHMNSMASDLKKTLLPDNSSINRTINEDPHLTKKDRMAQKEEFNEKGYYSRSATYLMNEKGVVETLEMATPDETKQLSDEDIVQSVECRHLTHAQREQMRKMLRKNIKVFSRSYRDTGTVEGYEVKVDIKPHEQTLQQRYVPLPLAARKEVNKILQQFLDLGVIEHSTDIDPYISNLLITKKKDMGIRVLIDLRREGGLSPSISPCVEQAAADSVRKPQQAEPGKDQALCNCLVGSMSNIETTYNV
jgi:hypothetical protein